MRAEQRARRQHMPGTVSEFNQRKAEFQRWLLAHGSEILAPSNEFELMRFVTPEGVGVIYRNAKGVVSSMVGGALEALTAHIAGDNDWRTQPKRDDHWVPGKNRHQVAAIINRDGNLCWYCAKAFVEGRHNPLRRTREHLVSVIHGGPDHLSNLVLSHQSCNDEAGHLSVAEKVRLREKKRSAP